MGNQIKLKKEDLNVFQSKQKVIASKIISIAKGREGSATIVLKGKTDKSKDRVVELDKHYVKKHNPRSGNYLTIETQKTTGADGEEVENDVYGYIGADVFEAYFEEVK